MKLNWYFLHLKNKEHSTLGFGITAWSKEDALNVLQKVVFKTVNLPEISEFKIISSLDELEQNHVRPNIGNPVIRGVWFPNYG